MRTVGGPLAALAMVVGVVALAPPAPAAAATVPCTNLDDVLVLTEDTELTPGCTYTGGIEIHTSDVTLDCRGAKIISDGPPGASRGILISSPVDVPLSGVTVRNCEVAGFLNDLKVTRDGFRTLPEGVEYDDGFSDIVVEDNVLRDSRGVGLFIDGYVEGVTVRRNLITRTGSSGIYLDTGSASNEIYDNDLVDNGYGENGPHWQTFSLGSGSFWWWGVGREGIAIDGSRWNHVHDNRFTGSSVGGILVYKNCGEYPEADRYYERRYGSHGNVIEGNRFEGELNGVWVGSRMAENTLPMECTDPAYIDEPGRRVVHDRASGNTVRGNTFDGVTYGIRVEDDDTVVEGNTFLGTGPEQHAVIIGTPLRTQVLGLPVSGTRLVGNDSQIPDSPTPYRWVHGHVGTTDEGNTALGNRVALCEGADPPRSAIIFVVTAALKTSSTPPPDPVPPRLPVLEPQAPCADAVLGPVQQPTTTTTAAPSSTTSSTPTTAPGPPPPTTTVGLAPASTVAPTATPVAAGPTFTG